jgi:hypothetical protein
VTKAQHFDPFAPIGPRLRAVRSSAAMATVVVGTLAAAVVAAAEAGETRDAIAACLASVGTPEGLAELVLDGVG